MNEELIKDPASHGFEPDRMVFIPNLPEGWDGDAWVRSTQPYFEEGYLIRAWRDKGELFAARGGKYEDACQSLRQQLPAIN